MMELLQERGFSQQQAYVSLQGCEGCVHGRCTPGCYVELLRRLLRVCFDACTLHPVAGGLATRPYRRAALAWPTAKTAPLADLSLTPWPEARLIVHWHGRGQLSCAALLSVGADGPEPAAALRAANWQAWALPKALGSKRAHHASALALPFPQRWPHAPTLLWPQRQGDSVLAGSDVAGAAPVSQLLAMQEYENIDASH